MKTAMALVRTVLRPAPEEARLIFARWSKKAYWTIEEAAMLGLGLDPQVPLSQIEVVLPEVLPRLHELLDLIKRRFPNDRVPPLELAEWDRKHAIGIATEVVTVIEGQDPARKPEPRPTDMAKIQRSLETMIVAMAIDKYGYNPGDKKSSTAKSIEGAVNRIGAKISQGAVLTRLKDALYGDTANPDLTKAVQQYFATQSQLGR